ncbi:MAG TPA: tyrosine-type recombinase/integrase, partial [Kofleriaceae bacterium]|nr:tyrosine-type recombinase/integrase [Kofleriaceae bacterium]
MDLGKLTPRDLIEFVTERAKHCKPGTAKLVATALRSFLRFLQMSGIGDARLVAAVPIVPNWKLARLPKILTSAQLRSLLRAFDQSSATGRRDYAMVLCLAQMGLRAHEVAQLALDDIDWRAGTLRIAIGKSRRESMLPLPVTVGRGLVAYLRDGRPAEAGRNVFVRHRVCVGKPLTSSAVCSAIRRAFERAQIAVPSKVHMHFDTRLPRACSVVARVSRISPTFFAIAASIRRRSTRRSISLVSQRWRCLGRGSHEARHDRGIGRAVSDDAPKTRLRPDGRRAAADAIRSLCGS